MIQRIELPQDLRVRIRKESAARLHALLGGGIEAKEGGEWRDPQLLCTIDLKTFPRHWIGEIFHALKAPQTFATDWFEAVASRLPDLHDQYGWASKRRLKDDRMQALVQLNFLTAGLMLPVLGYLKRIPEAVQLADAYFDLITSSNFRTTIGAGSTRSVTVGGEKLPGQTTRFLWISQISLALAQLA